MDDARLHGRLGEDRLDRVREAGQPVNTRDQDVLNAALLEIGEDLHPELRALGLLEPLVERAMEVELNDHVGYEAHQEPPGGGENTRNGTTPQTLDRKSTRLNSSHLG